jgi:hypothetical protein
MQWRLVEQAAEIVISGIGIAFFYAGLLRNSSCKLSPPFTPDSCAAVLRCTPHSMRRSSAVHPTDSIPRSFVTNQCHKSVVILFVLQELRGGF